MYGVETLALRMELYSHCFEHRGVIGDSGLCSWSEMPSPISTLSMMPAIGRN